MTGQSAPTPALSVIVPCLGHAEELRACLAALAAQDLRSPYEVIVVDSASDDRVAAVAAQFPRSRLVRSTARLSAGAARNLGVESAAGDILVFTDADCIPDAGFLRAAEAALSRGAKLATGPILNATDAFIAACDNLLQFVDFAADRPAGTAQYAPGCNLAIRSADFVAAGAFPEGRAEDTRLSIAVANRWPGGLVFAPDMRVSHVGRGTFDALVEHHRAFGFDRARHSVHLEPWHRSLGRYRLMGLPIASKRFSYIVARTVKWNRARLPFVLLSSPVLIAGLLAWAQGFRAGLLMKESATERQ